MSQLFYGCNSLKSFPDISKWDITNLVEKKEMFNNCSKSLNIPLKFN